MSLFSRGYDAAAAAAALAKPTIDGMQRAFATLAHGNRQLVDPRASLNPFGIAITPPPALASRETAAEVLEAGLMSLHRDDHIDSLSVDPAHAAALAALDPSTFSAEPDQLFRLFRYCTQDRSSRVSSLLTKPVPTGWSSIDFMPRSRQGSYGATADDWAAWQAGSVPRPQALGNQLRVTGRYLASLVHQDAPYLIPLLVSQQLLAARAPLSNRFPPLISEVPFVGGGGAVALQCALAAPVQAAMRDAWYYKWTFSRPRPDQLWRLGMEGKLHPDFLTVGRPIIDRVGPYLSSCYAEGAPVHSDYPAGHATIAGAAFTILKAWFANGPVPSLGITHLHQELDLMAWCMSVGRSWAGIHTRSSLISGLALGEAHAVAHLNVIRLSEHRAQQLKETRIFGFQFQALRV
jgi:hypothetical protein